jgi:hypothetical protein
MWPTLPEGKLQPPERSDTRGKAIQTITDIYIFLQEGTPFGVRPNSPRSNAVQMSHSPVGAGPVVTIYSKSERKHHASIPTVLKRRKSHFSIPHQPRTYLTQHLQKRLATVSYSWKASHINWIHRI